MHTRPFAVSDPLGLWCEIGAPPGGLMSPAIDSLSSTSLGVDRAEIGSVGPGGADGELVTEHERAL